jgi:hypothetical protein
MAKVLNLDEVLVAEPRELVLGGRTHVVQEMSVEDYIDAVATGKKISADSENTELAMKETARLIQRQVPTVEASALMKLPLEKLYAIAEFVRGVDPEQILAKASGAAQEGEGASPNP